MKKLVLTICILIFILVTVFVFLTDNAGTVRRVQVTNKNLAINNKLSNFENEDISIAQKESNIENSEVVIKDKSTKVGKKEFKLDENSIFRNSEARFENENRPRLSNIPLNSRETDLKILRAALDKPHAKTSINKEDEKYGYKYIDWRTWKSNFVNKIVDDSLQITSLDDYPKGTAIYYSFTVYNDGSISDVTVTSPFVAKKDKDKLTSMIQKYEYTTLTEFPRGAKRKSVWVHAIMLLSDDQTYSTPKDFDLDTERVKYKL
jgi:archaellum component FlaF (FlaF/FlaG flagellin family)